MVGQVQPYAAVVLPLDHDSHEGFLGKFNTAITVGAAAPLQ
jgi:hypothetical protein